MVPALLRQLLPATLLLLAGCSALQPKPPQPGSSPTQYRQHQASLEGIAQFELQGRIGVQTNPRGFSGSLQWRHERAHDEILLFSPLGGQVAQISANPEVVTLLTSDGERFTASDAAALTQKTLGWSLPMQGLTDWVLGRPASDTIDGTRWDAEGRITSMRQDGWDIEYADYVEVEGRQLPSRISLKSPQLNLKLIVTRWQLAPSAADQAATSSEARP